MLIDFETRSRIPIKAGAWRYAADATTEVMCLAYRDDDGETHLWHPGLDTAHLTRCAEKATRIQAFNAQFELAVWEHIMVPRFGFPAIPMDKWECLMARCAARSLPMDLHSVCIVLGCDVEKDAAGHRLMMKMCKPQKDGTFFDTPEARARLYAYCVADIDAEYAVSRKVPAMPGEEQARWVLDQEINRRGIPVDLPACEMMIDMCRKLVAEGNAELNRITDGALDTVGQHAKIAAYCDMPDGADKYKVADALASGHGTPLQRQVLEIRQKLSKTSVAKYDALKRMAGADARVRGTLRFHKATTGRWGGVGFQPHNLPSPPKGVDAIEVLEEIRDDADWAELLYGDKLSMASWCVRPTVCASPGKTLYSFDYKAIEGRVLAWLTDDPMLSDYETGDPYVTAASWVGEGTPRKIGKVLELACGYQGSVGACKQMAGNFGVSKPDEEWKTLVDMWRGKRQPTVSFWYDLERACKRAIQRGATETIRCLRIRVVHNWLAIKLPSGRCLWYPQPSIERVETPWGAKDAVTFWGQPKDNERKEDYLGRHPRCKRWVHKVTYGGKLTENVVQAIARDLLCFSMQSVTDAGRKVIFHVHDELNMEDEPGLDMNELRRVVERKPGWAHDLPLKAVGWTGERYRK